MSEANQLDKRSDVVPAHRHSIDDLPVGVGEGMLAPGGALPVLAQPSPITAGPTYGGGGFVVIPEMGASFTLPALPDGASAWLVSAAFSGTFSVDTAGATAAIAMFVDTVEEPFTRRNISVAGGGAPGEEKTLAWQKDVLLPPGLHTVEAYWDLLAGGPALITNTALQRTLTVTYQPVA